MTYDDIARSYSGRFFKPKPVRIEVFRCSSLTNWRELPDAFSPRSDRPMRWLQRLAFWVLRRLRCYHRERFESVSHQLVPTDDAVECAFSQLRETSMHHRHPKTVYVGWSAFEGLSAGLNGITAPLDLSGRLEICGLPVVVIPWMSGILVV